MGANDSDAYSAQYYRRRGSVQSSGQLFLPVLRHINYSVLRTPYRLLYKFYVGPNINNIAFYHPNPPSNSIPGVITSALARESYSPSSTPSRQSPSARPSLDPSPPPAACAGRQKNVAHPVLATARRYQQPVEQLHDWVPKTKHLGDGSTASKPLHDWILTGRTPDNPPERARLPQTIYGRPHHALRFP